MDDTLQGRVFIAFTMLINVIAMAWWAIRIELRKGRIEEYKKKARDKLLADCNWQQLDKVNYDLSLAYIARDENE